jgi:hypothetical protein
MHQAAKFQFERAAREFAQWRAVPEDGRSPAPAWWWQPAFEVVAQHEEGSALVLSSAASGWFDLRRGRCCSDGDAYRSDILAVAGRIPAQDRARDKIGKLRRSILPEKEKIELCMLGALAIALSIMVIVYFPVWYR